MGAIRKAGVADVPAMVELSERRRTRYQDYQPTFWREAADSRARQSTFFEGLVGAEHALALVHERDGVVDGFAVAQLTEAPPVYDPGGLTCAIDDFCVADEIDWPTVGRALLDEARREARGRGAVQVVVVCAHLDGAKRALLASLGLGIASEWWVGGA